MGIDDAHTCAAQLRRARAALVAMAIVATFLVLMYSFEWFGKDVRTSVASLGLLLLLASLLFGTIRDPYKFRRQGTEGRPE